MCHELMLHVSTHEIVLRELYVIAKRAKGGVSITPCKLLTQYKEWGSLCLPYSLLIVTTIGASLSEPLINELYVHTSCVAFIRAQHCIDCAILTMQPHEKLLCHELFYAC